ncbi:T9SS type A sorting domain-containing protein [Chryseobacterium sp. SSA4.19]|nr:T9SS type A sorting domain-containing protein [Chryseobacterium sp. SSA4.19]
MQSLVLQDIKLSPNPASSQAALEFHLREDAKVTVLLADYNGTTLKTISNSEMMRKGTSKKNFSISELPNGVYVISILANSEKKSIHLIVKH